MSSALPVLAFSIFKRKIFVSSHSFSYILLLLCLLFQNALPSSFKNISAGVSNFNNPKLVRILTGESSYHLVKNRVIEGHFLTLNCLEKVPSNPVDKETGKILAKHRAQLFILVRK